MAFVEFKYRISDSGQIFIRRVAVNIDEIIAVQERLMIYEGRKQYPQTRIGIKDMPDIMVIETYDEVMEKIQNACEYQERGE